MFKILSIIFLTTCVLSENITEVIDEPLPNTKLSKFYNCKEFERDESYKGHLCTFEHYERRYDILPVGNSQITEVDFQLSELFDIPTTLFKIFPKVEYVNMSNTLIKRISTTSFRSGANLKTVVLDNNEVRTLPENAFRGAMKLEVVSLKFNRITEVDRDAFKDSVNLKELYLNGNSIESLDPATFYGLEKLSIVSLTENKLKDLDVRMFYKNPVITEVYLNKNFLEKLSLRFRQNSLVTLDVSDNGISELKLHVEEENLFKTKFSLNANNNNITSFANISSKLKLNELRASNNSIHEFSSVLSRFSITVLDLSHTRFGPILKNTFSNLIHLKELSLNNSKVTEISEDAFKNNEKLEVLNVANNKLMINDVKMFESAKELKILDISGNIISPKLNINEFKSALKHLERLDLETAHH
ncbi:chaoptin-like [Culicoides brevitarsis]|uniref:chaoptin-like n=1 Tax=Culicoides brevitarsis TaxID=469753 RepID=UPI00307BF77E